MTDATPDRHLPAAVTRMTWHDFDERCRALAYAALALRGADPTPEMRAEARILFGCQADAFLWALRQPPWMCPTCGWPHQGWQPHCYECEKEAEEKAKEAEIEARVTARLKSTGEL